MACRIKTVLVRLDDGALEPTYMLCLVRELGSRAERALNSDVTNDVLPTITYV